MSKGKIPTILSGYLDLHCPTDKPSTLLALVPFEQWNCIDWIYICYRRSLTNI